MGEGAGWSAKDGVLATKGQPNGYVRTVNHYRNYRLSLEWRWTGEPTNSGVLLHAQGPDKVWPKCVEAQLKHENAGDFWLLSQSTLMVDGNKVGPTDYGSAPKRGASAEKPPGQWNRYEISRPDSKPPRNFCASRSSLGRRSAAETHHRLFQRLLPGWE